MGAGRQGAHGRAGRGRLDRRTPGRDRARAAGPPPSAVVDHLAVGNGSGRSVRARPRRRPLVVAGCVLLLVLGVASLAWAPVAWTRGTAIAAAGVCADSRPPATEPGGCLVAVPGRIDGRSGRSQWRFAPSDPRLPTADVRFVDDHLGATSWPAALTRLLGGEPTTAQYWGTVPVAFVVDGTRVPTRELGTSTAVVGAWFGVMGLSFGLAGLPGLLGRRPGRFTLGLTGSGLGALVDLVVATSAPGSWTAQALVWCGAVVLCSSLPARLVSPWADLVEAQARS